MGERGQVFDRAENGTPERVIAESCARAHLPCDICGLVEVARDLLADDTALLVEIVFVEPWSSDEVGNQVDGLWCRLRAYRDVKRDHVMGCRCVLVGAQLLRGAVDGAVIVVFLAAPEHHVLEEMCNSVLIGPLGACARVEGDHDGGCARAVDAESDAGEGRCRESGRQFEPFAGV